MGLQYILFWFTLDEWYTLLTTPKHKDRLELLNSVDILVIDEISMAGLYLFEKIVDILNQHGKPDGKYLLVGDFGHLRPVGEPYLLGSNF